MYVYNRGVTRSLATRSHNIKNDEISRRGEKLSRDIAMTEREGEISIYDTVTFCFFIFYIVVKNFNLISLG